MAGWPRRRPAVPVALAILADATPDIPGFDSIPEPRPEQFYVLSRIGGVQSNPKFDTARLLIECWAPDGATAEDMACDVSAAFRNARAKFFADAFIYSWGDEQGPTDFNDPDVTDRRRCQLIGDLSISTE